MATAAAPELAELAASGLVDARWYRERYPDIAAAGLEPAGHYLEFGVPEGRWPNPYFDTAWYVRQNPDVAGSGLNPAIHFHRHGDLEGRRPHPLVDPAWYRQAYELSADTRALSHFLTMRRSGRYAPSAELWAVPHLTGEGIAPGTDLFAPYVTMGGTQPLPDAGLVRASGLLDPNFYLINGNDVHAAKIDPVEHYCHFGWQEARRPNIYFDPIWYVHTNPELERLRVNPLVHYLLIGEAADRRPTVFFEPAWYRRTYQVSSDITALGHFLTTRRSQSVSPNHLFDVGWYVAAHAESLGPHRDPFAHYLQTGTLTDIDPSPGFDAAGYRKRHMGRPSRGFRRLMRPERDNPLVHRLEREYRFGDPVEPEQEPAGTQKREELSSSACSTMP